MPDAARLRRWIARLIPLAVAGCGSVPLPVAVRPPGLPRPEAVLYLIGDAGDATPDLPVLRLLRDDVRDQAPDVPVAVAFLGDNIYEAGMHDGSDPRFAADSSRLEAQVDVLRGTRARGLFLPGNHDWADAGRDGLRHLENQRAFLERRARSDIRVEMQPVDGCPGPVVRELGDAASLVILDTQWWLQDRRQRTSPGCPHDSEESAATALGAAIAEASPTRAVIVLGHHPLQSFGPHGAYFSAREVFFPLTEVVPWLYLPVPFVVPAARAAGVSSQDLAGPRYRAMRRAISGVFENSPRAPLLYAAGHEHSLQVIEGTPSLGLQVVSGAGSKLTTVAAGPGALFVAGAAHGELGYMRLELFPDGRALLSAFTDGTRTCAREEAPCVPRRMLRYARFLR